MGKQNESWGSRTGLILAMAGNAVGLGNFLRFPVQAIQNGGGTFIIPYLVCFVVMGIPLLFTEWSIGRFGGKLGNHSTPYILGSMSKSSWWKYIGVFGIFTNIAVVAYYTYIESWTFIYVIHTVIGTFTGMSQDEVSNFFVHYVNLDGADFGIAYLPVLIYLLVLGINIYILSTGLGGIEKVAKIGMPLLILFGAVLAYKGWTMGADYASDSFPNANAWDGINFLWTPQYTSLLDPKVWLAAAGQIFFTLSVGMGSIQCYASYLKENEDIALNSLTSGFTNEMVEIVLGSAIVIPIAAGFLGLDWVIENAGFGMAFQTMPYLFMQWGELFGTLAGLCWFGLLFFAGITSSLAMGTPWMGFMQDEFGWGKVKGAISFGVLALLMGLPTILFYQYGYFDEYDYWAGTVSLVVFALLEMILFTWVFGMQNAWTELNRGADIKIPAVYKWIMKYITPVLLMLVLAAALITPHGNDWVAAFSGLFEGEGWKLDPSSLISKVSHEDLKLLQLEDPQNGEFYKKKIFFSTLARIQLVALFALIALIVWYSGLKRKSINHE
ncbi:sodium:calcium symporter [Algoriphagus sp. D3-2-R+10]|uniref:sodium:calcium symporter n=1 Tax=Algoriphagus aurantiacus TaxID=3103948 RepID=UPI002B3F7181|nr:sodium:calcium symporter [Algoriphagus sp. D3-2-R+10]MEB2775216.1 sodium:calcium symporter [Algoriphagus sp. D3-2-R+10]